MPFASTSIYLWSADSPEGPWLNEGSVYRLQAPYNDTSKVFCYAPKAHPELARAANEIILTFMSNTISFTDILDMPNVYIPQAVRIKIYKNIVLH